MLKYLTKRRIAAGLWLALMSTQLLHAQHPWASEVKDFSFGDSQTFGQDSAYFPANVLGPVGSGVTVTTPASLPTEIVSLGKGGYIVLGFDYPIIDGPGPDFTVFENAFFYPGGVFDEWMIVSVSPDGENWLVFPHDTLTGEGMAGRTPTAGGVDYTNPAESGGDSFDLSVLGLDTVRYVRVDDATRYQGPDRLAAELDAVIALHTTATVGLPSSLPAGVHMQHAGSHWYIRTDREMEATLMTLQGRELHRFVLKPAQTLEYAAAVLPVGAYVWILRDQGRVYAKKWLH